MPAGLCVWGCLQGSVAPKPLAFLPSLYILKACPQTLPLLCGTRHATAMSPDPTPLCGTRQWTGDL